MKHKSFIFNIEWQEILLAYPAEVRLEVYDAIIEYVASGTLSELKPMAKMAFSFIKKEIDYNINKYQEVCAKRRLSGKKGGEKRQKQAKQANATNCYQLLPNDSNCNFCQHDNDNDNDIKENIPNGISKKEELSSARIDYPELMSYFNNTLGGIIPSVRTMTEARKKAVKSRVREHGKESIITVFENVRKSSFLTGRNENGWQATFDWIFSPRNYVKILEGNYNDKSHGSEEPTIYTIPE